VTGPWGCRAGRPEGCTNNVQAASSLDYLTSEQFEQAHYAAIGREPLTRIGAAETLRRFIRQLEVLGRKATLNPAA
jgi:hypothetical protein